MAAGKKFGLGLGLTVILLNTSQTYSNLFIYFLLLYHAAKYIAQW